MNNEPDVVLSEAFLEMMMMAHRMNISGLERLPACWELDIDRDWWIAVNGGTLPRRCSKNIVIPPAHMHVFYKGETAGLLHLNGGTFLDPSKNIERDFIEALKRRQ